MNISRLIANLLHLNDVRDHVHDTQRGLRLQPSAQKLEEDVDPLKFLNVNLKMRAVPRCSGATLKGPFPAASTKKSGGLVSIVHDSTRCVC